MASHKDQLAERLSPEKLKIAIKDIIGLTIKEKDREIHNLEKLVSETESTKRI